MFHLIQQPEYSFIAIMAFRESGKSTIMNTANVLWSILGKPEKKFVLIVGKTQEQAKSHFANIKAELENNQLLKEDFGPFTENADDLKRLSLELVYHGSKIMSVTREQSIRGLKYGQYRPDLIICDDLEDISSIFDHTETTILYERFEKEIVPLGSLGTRIVVLGNLISEDSFMLKIREDIRSGKIAGVFRTYPLLDDNGKNLWERKYTSRDILQNLQNKLSLETWNCEYLLSFHPPIHFLEEPGELPSPLDTEYWTALRNQREYQLSQTMDRYRDVLSTVKSQKALIPQMEEYKISAPEDDAFPAPEKYDSRYNKYVEFIEEANKISTWYKERYMNSIRARAVEHARRKEKVQD